MLSTNDLQFYINNYNKELPIKVQSISFDAANSHTLFKLLLQSNQPFPTAQTTSVEVTVVSTNYYRFSMCCSMVSVCPQYPEELVNFESVVGEDTLSRVNHFFIKQMNQAFTDKYIIESPLFGLLFCRSDSANDIIKMYAEYQKNSALLLGKLGSAAALRETKNAFLALGNALKMTKSQPVHAVLSDERAVLQSLQKSIQGYVLFMQKQIELRQMQLRSCSDFVTQIGQAAQQQQKPVKHLLVFPVQMNELAPQLKQILSYYTDFALPVAKQAKQMSVQAELFWVSLQHINAQIESAKGPSEPLFVQKSIIELKAVQTKQLFESFIESEFKNVVQKLSVLESELGAAQNKQFLHAAEVVESGEIGMEEQKGVFRMWIK
ncbi:Conserved_hypothetical protein [Hexamita inflata]|uniref:Uncharacterized protein n=1 Tax=Hexamita inflata TaxID=28002 RepID=A0AA86UGW7_9EUKA|nr:Conserved hypothetical protein [Hexamita inflata]